jgi:diguanylate cyclase (GGDEF)-like protein
MALSGPHIGQVFRLGEGASLLFGRGMDANVRLLDDGVSRRHARITTHAGRAIIEDLRSANGTWVNGAETNEKAPLRDGDKVQIGGTTLLVFSCQDDLGRQFQRDLFDAVQRDPLTKAFNRRVFAHHIASEFAFARRHRSELAILLFDADHFKRVNDAHGHLAGDAVLITLARTVASVIRADDFFARYGGEEFAVVCRQTPRTGVLTLAERIRTSIERAVTTHDGVDIRCTVSVGIGMYPASGVEDADGLFARADAALYDAKDRGRNRVVCPPQKSASS